MSVEIFTEMSATSTANAEDAINAALEKARITLINIADTWVDDKAKIVANDKVPEYRVSMKITFHIS